MEDSYGATARYYDKLYAWKDYEAESARLLELLGGVPRAGASLLDVACGTGGHVAHLRRHFAVEGLDLSPEQLAIARAKHPGVPFHVGDMTRFDLGRAFDVVTCLFSSIGHAKTPELLRAAARCMANHVKLGGALVVEPWFTPEAWHPHSVHGSFIDEPELKIARVNTSFVEGRLSVFDLHYLIGTPNGTEHLVEHYEMGLFTVEEMRDALSRPGWTVTYDAEGLSGRGLFIARRSAG